MRMVRALLCLPLVLAFIIPVHATTPTHITATVNSGVATIVESRTAGSNTITTATQQLSFTGGMQGSSVQTFTFVVGSTGRFTNHGTGLFTGTVNGSQLGTAEYRFDGTGSFTTVSQEVQVVFGHGTGGLAGFHAQGTAQQSGTFDVATVSLLIHLDPA